MTTSTSRPLDAELDTVEVDDVSEVPDRAYDETTVLFHGPSEPVDDDGLTAFAIEFG